MLFKIPSNFKSIAVSGSTYGKLQSTIAIALLATCFTVPAQAQPASQPVPPALIGTWQVTTVHTDSGASRTPHYQQNDRRLVGRLFLVSAEKVTSNTPEGDRCETPRVATLDYKPSRLIQESMAGHSSAPERPTAADYSLPLPADGVNDVFTLQCKGRLWGASLGREDGIQGVWMLKLDEDRLALRWYDETILELSRVPPEARPKASYDCHRAANPAEKTICGSVGLASLDVSIADAYAAASKRLAERIGSHQRQALNIEQRNWISQRNECAADAVCLQKSMTARLEELEILPADE